MNFIIVVGAKVVWEGRDREDAFKARDAIIAGRGDGYNLPGVPKVYELSDVSKRWE